jgi:hypothetical protein
MVRWHLVLEPDVGPIGPLGPQTSHKGVATVALELPPGKRFRALITTTNDAGAPTPVEAGSAVFGTSDASVLSVEKIDDATALFRRVAPGVAIGTYDSDGDPGAGVAPLHAEMEFAVTTGVATHAAFAGAVEDDV